MSESEVVTTLRAAGCVFAEDEAALLVGEAHSPEHLADLVSRRAAGEPLEHVLGWAEFCGLRIVVEPGVFVPRRRTEFLVHHAAELLHPGGVVLDLCCGSGAIAAAVAARVAGLEVHAADLSGAAVGCARRNLGNGHVYEGDLYDPLPPDLRGRVDVLIANAPYVPTGDIRLMPPEARVHEPLLALDGGVDGLAVLRRVIAGAADWLAPTGSLLVETTSRQAAPLVRAMTEAGLRPRVVRDEAVGATVVVAAYSGHSGHSARRATSDASH